MSLSYALEKLRNAVSCLVTDPGTILARLAGVINAGVLHVDKNDIPSDLSGDLQLVQDGLGKVINGNIDEQEASELAEKIFLLYEKVMERVSRAG